MKWALAQLYKYNGKPFSFAETLEFSEEVAQIDDILDLSAVEVEGYGQNVYLDRFVFNLHIEAKMTLECALTLEAVIFPIKLDVVEIYDKVDDGEVNLLTTNTIDLRPLIWELIYLEKPMRITKYDNSDVNRE